MKYDPQYWGKGWRGSAVGLWLTEVRICSRINCSIILSGSITSTEKIWAVYMFTGRWSVTVTASTVTIIIYVCVVNYKMRKLLIKHNITTHLYTDSGLKVQKTYLGSYWSQKQGNHTYLLQINL